MDKDKLTHEQVDALEDTLRKAQDTIEEAGRMLCSVSGETGPQLWNKINSVDREIAEIIHQCYKLRPWGE